MIDRIRTNQPHAVIVTKDDGIEVTLYGVALVIQVAGDRVGVGRAGAAPEWLSRREFENHVTDELNAIWREHETARPKRQSSGGCSSSSGGGDGDAVGTFVDHDADADDDGDD